MADVMVRFACGHAATLLGSDTGMSSVQCGRCGERRVRSVSGPQPTIRAVDCDAKSPLLVKESK